MVVLVVGVLTARLFYLQLANGGRHASLVDDNRILLQAIPSARGLVYDRNGQQLVTNRPSYAVKVRPADLPYLQREAVVALLATILHRTTTEINTAIDSNPGSRFDLVRVASDVPENVARLISEDSLQLPGVEVVVEATRQYDTGPLLSQLLGYTGAVSADDLKRLQARGYLPDDAIGKDGLEAQYETQLRGSYGLEQVQRDATGRELGVLSQVRPPQSGDSLQLSIDLTLQQQAQQALEWGLQAAHLTSGVFIVMNPQTGEVLAMVSLPTYDDNLFAQGISNADFANLIKQPGQPLLNHAISEQFPPGSTWKLVPASGALQDGKITDQTQIPTYPILQLGTNMYGEWNHRGLGPLTVTQGFVQSSDTFFYQVAAKLGIDRLAYWAQPWGFGAPTGIDLPGEVAGIVPSNAWKEDVFGQPIYPGEVYLAGIGQSYDAVTPLQLLDAYCALANGGRLLQPQVVRQVVGPDGSVVQAFAPISRGDLGISQSVLRTIRIRCAHGGHERPHLQPEGPPARDRRQVRHRRVRYPRRPGTDAVPQLVRRLGAPEPPEVGRRPRRPQGGGGHGLTAGVPCLCRTIGHGRQRGDGDRQVLPADPLRDPARLSQPQPDGHRQLLRARLGRR